MKRKKERKIKLKGIEIYIKYDNWRRKREEQYAKRTIRYSRNERKMRRKEDGKVNKEER